MRFISNTFTLVSYGLAASLSVTAAQAQTTLEPLPPLPPVEPLNKTRVDASERSRVELAEMPAMVVAIAPAKTATTQSAYYEVVTPIDASPRRKAESPASLIAGSGMSLSRPVSLPAAPSVGRDLPSTRSTNAIVSASKNGSQTLVAIASTRTALPLGRLEGIPTKRPSSAPVTTSYAQPATQIGLSVPAIAPSTQAVLRAQTQVQLRLREELTTKKKAVRIGQRFQLEVAEAITVDGLVVVPVGTPATGEITEVRNKGMWGKSGYINARAVSMRVGDRSIRLTGTFDDKGVTGTGGVVAAVATIPLLGFVTTGTSAMIPMGMQVKAFVDEDVPLAFSAAAVAPMSVAAPSQPMPVAAPK